MTLEYSEEDVMKRLGVAREYLRGIREKSLKSGKDFGLKNRQIWYSNDGLEKLCFLISAPIPEKLPPQPQDQAPAPEQDLTKDKILIPPGIVEPGAKLTAIVTEIYPKNKHYLEARTNEGDVLMIHVRDTTNFVKGMEIPSGLVRTHARLLDYVGRLPRRRGAF